MTAKGSNYIFASPNVNASLLYREIVFLEDGGLLFYGQSYNEKDVEIMEGDPPDDQTAKLLGYKMCREDLPDSKLKFLNKRTLA